MIYLDIETLDFFQDPVIKALPRDQQIKAMRFGCAVTCEVAPRGKKIVHLEDNHWQDDGVVNVAEIDAVWRTWTADQISDLYNYLCWAHLPVCGWNTLAFDWPVILNNAERTGVQLIEIEHETVAHIDLFDFIRQMTGRWYSFGDGSASQPGPW